MKRKKNNIFSEGKENSDGYSNILQKYNDINNNTGKIVSKFKKQKRKVYNCH